MKNKIPCRRPKRSLSGLNGIIVTLISPALMGLMIGCGNERFPGDIGSRSSATGNLDASLPPALYAALKADIEYWEETGISFGLLTEELNDRVCFSSVKAFIPCMEALRKVALNEGFDLVRGPKEKNFGIPPLGQSQASKLVWFAPVEENKSASENLPMPEYFAKEKEARLERVKLWKDLFGDGRPEFSFPEIMSIVQNVGKRPLRPDEIAEVYNTYLGLAEDAHNYIIPAAKLEDMANSADSSFVGIGISYTQTPSGLLVTKVFHGGPAAEAGIRQGDLIEVAGGKSLRQVPAEVAASALRGEPGSSVNVFLRRRGQETFERTLTRRKIVVHTAGAQMLGDTLLLTLNNFTQTESPQILKKALLDHQNETKGVILDLRDNPGGLIQQAADIAGLFLPKHSLVTTLRTIDGNDVLGQFKTAENPVSEKPLTVVVDGGSASASELLAQALKDHNRVTVVGARTFGKGSAQRLTPFINPHVAMFTVQKAETIALYYSPEGITPQAIGVIPDVEADFLPNIAPAEAFVPREADLYPTFHEAVSKPATPSPRSEAISHCVKDKGQADQRFNDTSASVPEYPVLVAMDALLCEKNIATQAGSPR